MSDQRPDEDGAIKPQVIDLDAEEIKTEDDAPAASSEVPPPPPPQASPARRKRRGTALWIIAALAAGLLAGGWIYRDLLSGYLPSDAMVAMQGRIDALETNGKALNQQLAAVSQSADSAAQGLSAIDQAVKGTASGIADLGQRISTFESRADAAEESLKAAQADLATLRSALSSGGGSAASGPSDPAVLAALGQRIDALEKDVVSLKSASGGGEKASITSALSQALSDLKAKIAAGTPYQAEQDRIARMVPAAPGLDVLAAHAAQGLPAAAGLAGELRAAIPALPQPETAAPAEKSYWDEVLDTFSGIVTVRTIGEANWPQLADKAAALAETGDLTQAISVIDGAEGSKPSALTQWRDRAVARLQLEAATNQVSEAVLRQIAALGGAQ